MFLTCFAMFRGAVAANTEARVLRIATQGGAGTREGPRGSVAAKSGVMAKSQNSPKHRKISKTKQK